MDKDERLIARQIATVRMICSEKENTLSGAFEKITMDNWSRWLDLDVADINALVDCCNYLDPFEIASKAMEHCTLNGVDRICALRYLKVYGVVICKLYDNWDAESILVFLKNSINNYVETFVKKEKTASDPDITKKVIFSTIQEYMQNVISSFEDVINFGYDWEVIREMNCFFDSYEAYIRFKNKASIIVKTRYR